MNQPFDLSYPPPTITSASEEAFASSMAFANLSKEASVITADIKLLMSSGDPILKVFTSSVTYRFTSPHNEAGIYAREAAEHFCPWYSKAPRDKAVATSFASAEGCAHTKSLPPVSPTILG